MVNWMAKVICFATLLGLWALVCRQSTSLSLLLKGYGKLDDKSNILCHTCRLVGSGLEVNWREFTTPSQSLTVNALPANPKIMTGIDTKDKELPKKITTLDGMYHAMLVSWAVIKQ